MADKNPIRLNAGTTAREAMRGLVSKLRDVSSGLPSSLAQMPDSGSAVIAETLDDALWQRTDREAAGRAQLDTQADFIVRLDAGGQLTFANRAFNAAFSFSAADGTAPTICDGVQLVETAYGQRWIEWKSDDVASTSGAIERQYVGRDVTDDRRAKDDLKRAQCAAEAANIAKSHYLASMSHEIRTPMTGILGMVDLLSSTDLDAEQQTYTRAVDTSARALLELIDGILDLSKIEAGKIELERRAFSIRACVNDAVDLLRPKASEKNLDVQVTYADDLDDVLMGDDRRVRQIVLNLVSNAIKFTTEGGVSITVRPLANSANRFRCRRISIEVRDTGSGINPHDLTTLFDDYAQGKGHGARHSGGTGLGLSISKRLARLLGGDILAANNSDRGATFTAELQFERDEDTADIQTTFQQAIVPLPIDHRPRRILVAEDNDINALLACRIIERAGGQPVRVRQRTRCRCSRGA